MEYIEIEIKRATNEVNRQEEEKAQREKDDRESENFKFKKRYRIELEESANILIEVLKLVEKMHQDDKK